MVPLKQRAREFLNLINMNSTDQTLIWNHVHDLETTNDNGSTVPQIVKEHWKKWSLQNHPDKGGTTENFQSANSKYDAFKKWFELALRGEEKTNEAKERATEMAELKEKWDTAQKNTEALLKESKYEEAMTAMEVARGAFQQLHKVNGAVGRSKLEKEFDEFEKKFNKSKNELASSNLRSGAATTPPYSFSHNVVEELTKNIRSLEQNLSEKTKTTNTTNLAFKQKNEALQSEVTTLKATNLTLEERNRDLEARNHQLELLVQGLKMADSNTKQDNQVLEARVKHSETLCNALELKISAARDCLT
tara:strand:- start:10539 stop:11453 length:915 start_codon:yes stop_codon:yes gene_type:complete